MASLSPEEKLEFLLHVLATSTDWKPNYGAVAARLGINTNANAQRRFKSIVEADKKFILEATKDSTKVVDNSEGGAGESINSPVKTPKGRKRGKKDHNDSNEDGQDATPRKRGRKAKAKTEDIEDGDNEGNEIREEAEA